MTIYENLFEKVSRLKEVLEDAATGTPFKEIEEEYQELRKDLISNQHTKNELPEFVFSCRKLLDFWDFIKSRPEDTGYASRRVFLSDMFGSLLTMFEMGEHSSVESKQVKKEKIKKPEIFVASSQEGLSVAYGVQENLEHDADVTVWNQGVFQLSSNALDDLISKLGEFNFGIFVFTPDDAVEIRGEKYESVRDNVLFELGLFIGRLGKERCFIVSPHGQDPFRIPTDLFGVTPATYNPKRKDGNLEAALGPACNRIRKAIEKKNQS